MLPCTLYIIDRDTLVGAGTHGGLDGPGTNPSGGARFATPVQTEASCITGTESLSGNKLAGA
jgi:hypothetical protein